MKDNITIPVGLYLSMRADKEVVTQLRVLLQTCENSEEFYNKCISLLNTDSRFQEKLKNKINEK